MPDGCGRVHSSRLSGRLSSLTPLMWCMDSPSTRYRPRASSATRMCSKTYLPLARGWSGIRTMTSPALDADGRLAGGPVMRSEARDGYARLVAGYLDAFGPVTEVDLVWWFAATKATMH